MTLHADKINRVVQIRNVLRPLLQQVSSCGINQTLRGNHVAFAIIHQIFNETVAASIATQRSGENTKLSSSIRIATNGIDVRSHRWLGFTIAGAAAGLAGGLYTFSKGSIDPTLLGIPLSVDFLAMILLGGMQTVMGPVLGRFEFDLYGQTSATYSLCVLLVLFVLMRRLVHSPFGATLKAVRDNRLRAMSIGVSVHQRIAVIYTVAAAVAGAAGALLAQTTSFASIDVFDFHRSADLMLLLVIGGTGWLYGGVTGAIVFKLMQDWLSSITPQYWTFWIGLFLVVLVMVGRDRLIRPWTWWKGRP
jgi:ABC-type branched-subunit amino acid transport system permease subunit